jgi:hypothetical protein
MRGLFGLVGLLVALAVVGLVVRQQMAASKLTAATMEAQAGLPQGAASAAGNVVQQSQQIQQQVKQAVDAAMQPRPMPDDK